MIKSELFAEELFAESAVGNPVPLHAGHLCSGRGFEWLFHFDRSDAKARKAIDEGASAADDAN